MVTTQEAKSMRNGIDISGTIKRLGETRTVNTKSGTSISVRDCYLTDTVGEIKLTLWGDDTTLVSEGDNVSIKNGYTNSFKGEVSLTKGKYGKLDKE